MLCPVCTEQLALMYRRNNSDGSRTSHYVCEKQIMYRGCHEWEYSISVTLENNGEEVLNKSFYNEICVAHVVKNLETIFYHDGRMIRSFDKDLPDLEVIGMMSRIAKTFVMS